MKIRLPGLTGIVLTIIILTALHYSCQKDSLTAVPLIKNGEPDNIAARSASITGEILDAGEGIEQYGHCYSSSGTPTVGNEKTAKGGTSSKTSFSSELINLEAGATYQVRAYAISKGVEYYSDTKTIRTLSGRAEVTTVQAASVTHNSAACSGNITSDGGDQVTERGICWGTTPGVSLQDNLGCSQSGSGVGTFSIQLEDLAAGVTYYYVAWARTSVTVSYGDEKEFTTNSGIATVTTSAATEITINSVKTGGDVSGDGGVPVTEKGICWSVDPAPEIGDNKITSGNGTGSFSVSITGLSPDTRYYVRAYAKNEVDVYYGNQIDFLTDDGIVSVITADADDIGENSARLNGEVTDDGGAAVTERGFYWSSTDQTPDSGDNKVVSGSGTGSFSEVLTGLDPGTTYYFIAYATNSQGRGTGEVKSFRTLTETFPPSVVTGEASGITETSAILNGNVTSDGNATVTERGFYWSSTDPTPDSNDNKIVSGSGTGSFSKMFTGLERGTTYYFVAYATNSKGTVTGEPKSFITISVQLPGVNTLSAQNISNNGANLRGEVYSDGNATITARGFYLSPTDPSPDINDIVIPVGSGLGSFSEFIATLQPDIRYYVCAWAENQAGIKTGNTISFTTPVDEPLLNKVLTFREDFSNNDREWETGDEERTDPVVYHFGAKIENGFYKIYMDWANHWIRFGMISQATPVSGSNYEINSRFKIYQPLVSSPGVGISWFDIEYYHVIMCKQDRFWYQKKLINDGSVVVNDSYSVSSLNPVNQFNNLKIAAIGSEFRIYINGNYEKSYSREHTDLVDVHCVVIESESHIDHIYIYKENYGNKSSSVEIKNFSKSKIDNDIPLEVE